MRKRIAIYLLVVFGIAIIFVTLLPTAIDVYSSLQAYNTHVAEKSDYTKITTPLSIDTAADICLKFEIRDERCQKDAVVYGPDFFPDIKRYFAELSGSDATFELVKSKLGIYLVYCEKPANDGHYRCRYDLRGDGIYPIFVYFDKEGIYYRIIANIGGS